MMTRDFLSQAGATAKTAEDRLAISMNGELFDVMTTQGVRDITSKYGTSVDCEISLKFPGLNVNLSDHNIQAVVKKRDSQHKKRGGRIFYVPKEDESEEKTPISYAWEFIDIFAAADHVNQMCSSKIRINLKIFR
jgi:hypothetical protein